MRLTAKEIAERLGISRQAVAKRAQKEKWPYVEERNSNGGKPKKYFLIEDLPEDVRENLRFEIGDLKTNQCNHNATNATNQCNYNATTQPLENKGFSEGRQGVAEGENVHNVTDNATNATTERVENKGIEGDGFLSQDGLRNLLRNFEGDKGTENQATKEPDGNLKSENRDLIADGVDNLPDDDIYLTVEEVAELLGVTERAVRKGCKMGRFRVVTLAGKGQGGVQYRIGLSSLPPEGQVRFIKSGVRSQESGERTMEKVREKLCLQAQWELAKADARVLEVGENLDDRAREKLARMVSAVEKALSVPKGKGAGQRVREVAREVGVSAPQLYRWIRIYETEGLRGLARVASRKRDGGLKKWSEEALRYMEGVYLKGVRQAGGEFTMKAAYEAVVKEAEKRNWQVGSIDSAYRHLRDLHPLLVTYARGGRQALSNVFYIARDYRDLAPMECIVGDQHRFDFWVWEPETDRVFRPEAYFWMDLRTRLLVGLSIADRYDAYMIGLALRMAVKRFGAFGSCYTDNGRPERSRYFAQIGNHLAQYGMRARDISEIYRTPEGQYVVEDEEGEVVEVVDTPEAWHRLARAYNAKAKMIERFNRTLTQILIDMGTPGYVRQLKATAEEKRMDDRRLKELRQRGQLLTPEEFVERVFQAVERYNHRRHRILGRSPMEELMLAHRKEGWVPREVHDRELDIVLLRRERRSVNRGRVLLYGQLYEYRGRDERDTIENGLYRFPDKTRIEVRHNLPYEDRVYAVTEGEVLELVPVEEGSMKRPELTKRLNERKRRLIKAVQEWFRVLTAPVKGVLQFSEETRRALKVKRSQESRVRAQEEGKTAEEIMREAEEIVRATEERKVLPLRLARRGVFESERDRYEWCVKAEAEGLELSEADREFMRRYEAGMTEGERIWWECYRQELRWKTG